MALRSLLARWLADPPVAVEPAPPEPEPEPDPEELLFWATGKADVAMVRGDFETAEQMRRFAEEIALRATGSDVVKRAGALAKRIARWQTKTVGSAAPPRRTFS